MVRKRLVANRLRLAACTLRAAVNYLAHLFLAGDNPAYLVGHMLGDFVKPREIAAYRPEIQIGIRMHQRVDAFSDSHAVFAASRRRFQPPYRRFAGILVDLVYDHFLATHWDNYSPGVSLPEFTRRAYAVLEGAEAILPGRLQRMLPHMVEGDWLSSYEDLNNVARALRGISRRLRRENPLDDALGALQENYAGLDRDFQLFFPELVEFAAQMDLAPGNVVANGVAGGAISPLTREAAELSRS
jgi:acyl carrier protein phosphodiesterase